MIVLIVYFEFRVKRRSIVQRIKDQNILDAIADHFKEASELKTEHLTWFSKPIIPLNIIGPEGDFMVPTFSFSFVGHEKAVPFNVRSTPSQTGYITEVFRKRKEAKRSKHPTHAVAVIGPRADYLISGHEKLPAFGVGSPLELFARENYLIMMLGVDINACSMLHVAEILAECPYNNFWELSHKGWESKASIEIQPYLE